MLALRRVATSLLIIAVVVLASVVVTLLCLQNRMIYLPRHYEPGITSTLTAVPYHIREGAQTAWLRPPQGPLHRIWVLFGGNAGLALEWGWMCAAWPRADDALLLIDYPGYGANAGSPSQPAIERSCEAAYQACALVLQRSPEQLDQSLGVIGHSLGAAVGLQFCQRHPAQRLVLISPFTSLRDMARTRVGWPLCWLLRGNFDNRARLRELAGQAVAPQVLLVHGTADEVVPFAMGQELARIVPGTQLCALPGADHVSVLDSVPQLMAAAQMAR
jgi:pimeloyl-ACP methyl ester carboxylesterase